MSLDWARVRAVSWDVDGTLYDLPAVKRALRRRALLRGLLPGTWRDLRLLLAFLRAAEAVRREHGGDLSRLVLPAPREAVRAVERRWLDPAIARVGLRPGVRQAHAALAARGLEQVVLSDHPARSKLRALGAHDLFSRAFVGEELGWLKPSPRPFLQAAEALEIAPDQLLHLGDRDDSDGAGARAAGCQVVIVRAPRDLLELAPAPG